MKKIEYKTIVCGTNQALEKELDRYKASGWKIVNIKTTRFNYGRQSLTAYLKREK